MVKNKKIKYYTYLAGPMDDVSIDESRDWREMLGKELPKIGVGVLDPISKYGKDYGNVRKKFSNWMRAGNLEAIRRTTSNQIIPPDMEMVERCDFITLYIPVQGKEICGSYGEMTVGFFLGLLVCPKCGHVWKRKKIYIVTKRRLKPLNLPKWAIGCSTKIFTSWEEYLDYIRKKWDEN